MPKNWNAPSVAESLTTQSQSINTTPRTFSNTSISEMIQAFGTSAVESALTAPIAPAKEIINNPFNAFNPAASGSKILEDAKNIYADYKRGDILECASILGDVVGPLGLGEFGFFGRLGRVGVGVRSARLGGEGLEELGAGRSLGAARRPYYEAAPYHKAVDIGEKIRAPVNGQDALDISVQVKPTSPRRVGIDHETGDFVVFDRTRENIYHGHVRSWEDLHPDMQRALIDSGMVNKRGKFTR